MGFIGRLLKKDEKVGEGVGFDRIRRITGYLTGTLDRFNNAKKAEERDRVKHGIEQRNSTVTIENIHMECSAQDRDSFCPKS